MNWFWISVGALGGLFILLGRSRRRLNQKDARATDGSAGKMTIQERVEQVLADDDIDAMAQLLESVDDPVIRDALFGQLVANHYRLRSDPAHRDAFYRYAGQHVREIPAALDALEKNEDGRPDRVDSFKMMAIAMAEDQRYEAAIKVCETAMSLGLEDGTKTGFEGRIARLKKKRDAGS
ncbi:MAG: hypothetical protein KFF68_12860 [Desulfosarcina sp.]|nr:hypothetical protein [Desulfosarcina sp.]